MNRNTIIQSLINKVQANDYLEIGIGNGKNFDHIVCPNKISVDPHPPYEYAKATFALTSDDFFAQNKGTYDIIFIDGLHEADQVERDINNSLNVLNDGGYIVCHDMNPTSENMQKVLRIQSQWTGDCWKAWVKIRSTNPNVTMFVVDTDSGCGVIYKSPQEKLLDLKGMDLTYQNLEKNRQEWLHLISSKKFKSFLI